MQRYRVLLSKAVAESAGTFVIVFFGCGSLMISERIPDSVPNGAVPIVFGLAVTAMVYALSHISGAHFNPAVSLGFAVSRHFPPKQLLVYWLAQFSGAFMASALLAFTLPVGKTFGATIPAIPLIPAFLWEIVLGFFLMFVIIAVATDTRAVGTMAGVAIGGMVALAAYVGGPLTGASMNPARSLAPALFEGQTAVLWIYFLGPCLGAVLAALLYEVMRYEAKSQKKSAGT